MLRKQKQKLKQKRKFRDSRIPRGPKVCRLCQAKKRLVDYKELETISRYTTERGKIISRRITGNCAFHQRQITMAIKRARTIALLPFVAE